MTELSSLRSKIRSLHLKGEHEVLTDLVQDHGPTASQREQASVKAAELIRKIRSSAKPGLMEVFLAEYGLSTDEGVALMCLAEALLRVPDAETIDDLIEDKIAPSSWGEHLGKSTSSLVNASTWALMLTGKVLQDSRNEGLTDTLRGAVKRLGEPIIRRAVKRAMQEMGHQFVLGQSISEAADRAKKREKQGYTYSYDMLGEAALTAKDAATFYDAYADAIKHLAKRSDRPEPRDNPGISIKLSALHPRYEVSQEHRVMEELVPRLKSLALMAKEANMGLNVDAEEADRLDLSLSIIEAVLRDPDLAGWDGFGVVVQAYGRRASGVIDWLHALAEEVDRKIMVRLVKGAYWDTEIKLAQVEGLPDFPVFTHKSATDIAYICCAQKLLDYSDRIYPQFATHNAHTVASILQMAGHNRAYEFQRLHGMGDALHDLVLDQERTRCRIYAPVGVHRDLLAYLVRRLLENGANSSFVNQLVDENVAPETIAADPFKFLDAEASERVTHPSNLYGDSRVNSAGWDLRSYDDLARFHNARDKFKATQWTAHPLIAGHKATGTPDPIHNPADPEDQVGQVQLASVSDVDAAIENGRAWSDATPAERCSVLKRAADLYEENAGEIFAVLCREAGKTAADAVSEIREAVDFLRFYALEAERLGDKPARGLITCISPWNFPLAIFTGQIAAALAAGNGVLAKPADPTPLTAFLGVTLLREAGVPETALQLLPGTGAEVGVKLTTDPRINGVCFTGSTGVAQTIYRSMSQKLEPDSTFIAETGGLNAMIVDSTALPQQAIQDIVDSAFRSCGQRCSALRVLYLQEDVKKEFMAMLYGAMDELRVGAPWDMATDVGPVINTVARKRILDHVEVARKEGRLLKQSDVPEEGLYVGPAVISVNGVGDLAEEIFGPILHVATFKAGEIDKIINDINASQFGLTFGLHTRIDDRVEHVTSRLNVGNMYVNRNQIGAVVQSQPFGGEGLSGTGPKAGGPHYVERFKREDLPNHTPENSEAVSFDELQSALKSARGDRRKTLEKASMAGPTGESNLWSTHPRGTILCLGPTAEDAQEQMKIARSCGCAFVGVAPNLKGTGTLPGVVDPSDLTKLSGVDGVALWADRATLTSVRSALAQRDGPLIPLIATSDMKRHCIVERHLCVDTTAAGGNASLLAAQ